MTSPVPRKGKKRMTKEELATFLKEMAAAIEAARPKASYLIDKAKAIIILDHPFFGCALLKRPVIERLDVPTLCVTATGKIYYNPLFVAGLTSQQVVFALCHETLHYLAGHAVRKGHRQPQKWNVAGDQWINDTLRDCSIGEWIPGIVDMPNARTETVEDLYDRIPEEEGGGGGGGGQSQQGGGDQQQSSSGDPLEDDIDDDCTDDAQRSEVDAQRKIDLAESAQVAKMRGKLSGVLAQFVADSIESKVPWYEKLERFFTEMSKTDEPSWNKPNRRYAPDYYIPAINDGMTMGEVMFVIDVSGSVSEKEIAHYNGHGKRIVEQCRPTKAHVLYTDTMVKKYEVFDTPEDFNIEFYSGGGTHMPAAFDFAKENGVDPSVAVVLTDGYTDFGEPPGFPVMWVISTPHIEAPHGESVHFEMDA